MSNPSSKHRAFCKKPCCNSLAPLRSPRLSWKVTQRPSLWPRTTSKPRSGRIASSQRPPSSVAYSPAWEFRSRLRLAAWQGNKSKDGSINVRLFYKSGSSSCRAGTIRGIAHDRMKNGFLFINELTRKPSFPRGTSF